MDMRAAPIVVQNEGRNGKKKAGKSGASSCQLTSPKPQRGVEEGSGESPEKGGFQQ